MYGIWACQGNSTGHALSDASTIARIRTARQPIKSDHMLPMDRYICILMMSYRRLNHMSALDRKVSVAEDLGGISTCNQRFPDP